MQESEAVMFEIREDDLSGEQARSLLALHLDGMRAHSPPGSVHALPHFDLQQPDVIVWTAWRSGRVASIGALRMLADGTGEVKSMRTHPEFLRMGAAAAILDRIIVAARSRGAGKLSLETGSGEIFEPVLRLYRKRGFVNGNAFGGYETTDFNQFLHLELTPSEHRLSQDPQFKAV
jgi:putative acetyltransferase